MEKLEINYRVWINRVSTDDELNKRIPEMAFWLNIEKDLAQNSRIVIKPNMTYPSYKPGITTGPGIIEAVVQVLRQITPHITLVESDGGAYAWPAEQAFAGHGIPDLCRKYDIKAVNLTQQPRVWAETEIGGKRCKVELPPLLLYETDYFITMPEIVGDAALTVYPYDSKEIGEAIHLLLRDDKMRKNLIKKGLVRVKAFSWEKAARQTLAVYKEAYTS